MLGLRRYRLFVLVVALLVVSGYHLTRSRPWSIHDLSNFTGSGFDHDRDDRYISPEQLKHTQPQAPHTDSERRVVTSNSIERSQSTNTAGNRSGATILDNGKPKTTSQSQSSQTSTELAHKAKPRLGTPLDSVLHEQGVGRLGYDTKLQDGKTAYWQQPPVHFPIPDSKLIRLPTSEPSVIPKIQSSFKQASAAEEKDRLIKLNTVRESFKHAWNGYLQHAAPFDEITPLSKSHVNPFMGWGATLVDSMDTLWLMDMREEFEVGVDFVKQIDFTYSMRKDIPLFETTIRYLGGLLGAYEISDHTYPVLLKKSEQLAEILIGAFDTPNHMPQTFYNWAPSYTSQAHRAGLHTVMSELGSLSMEFTRLAQLTKRDKYYDAVARITDQLELWQDFTLIPGLWPLKVDASGCKKPDHATLDEAEDVWDKPIFLNSQDRVPMDTLPAEMPLQDNARDIQAIDIANEGARAMGKVTKISTLKRRAVGGPGNVAKGPAGDVTNGRTQAPDSAGENKLRKMDQEILDNIECEAQALMPEANAVSQKYALGGQADSTYEYLPKMHVLLRGRSNQHREMYAKALKAMNETLFFRPMIKDQGRDLLFAARHEINTKAKNEKEKKIVTHEITHLSCFLGGMFGLASKIFDTPADMELARQFTEGCVWAYESMPTGIMAEYAAVVPCPDMKPCVWNETRWHEWLDPNVEERIAAVDEWNTQQKIIHDRAVAAAASNFGTPTATSKSKPTLPQAMGMHKRLAGDKRDTGKSLTPSTTTDPRLEYTYEDDSYNGGDSSFFTKKTALAHHDYVKARITEERLPSSYTSIRDRTYGLRPEALESVFYMYRLTGDKSWREKGWRMFEAIQRATRTEVANSVLKDVTSITGELVDKMESFYLAETLKYAYLLFAAEDILSLDEWVANTEAHFFRYT